MEQLNLRQRIFIEKYITHCGNATLAYSIAYNQPNKNSAGVAGHRMLSLVKIQAALDEVLTQAGLSSEAISINLKRKMNLSSLKGLELAIKLRGYSKLN